MPLFYVFVLRYQAQQFQTEDVKVTVKSHSLKNINKVIKQILKDGLPVRNSCSTGATICGPAEMKTLQLFSLSHHWKCYWNNYQAFMNDFCHWLCLKALSAPKDPTLIYYDWPADLMGCGSIRQVFPQTSGSNFNSREGPPRPAIGWAGLNTSRKQWD